MVRRTLSKLVKLSDMPDFDNNGASVHYQLAGSGRPLLMLAGIASDGASWGPLTPLLADRFRLILMDNRGSGRTKSEGEIAMRDILGDAVALLDRLGIEAGYVLGHSMGGMLGQRLAAAHPERVRGLVTLATSDRIGMKERLLFEELERLYFELPPQRWFALLFQWLFSDRFFRDPANVAAAAEAAAEYPYRQFPEDFARQVVALKALPAIDLTAIRCPVLAIAAAQDLLIPPATVAAGHLGIPDCRLETIEAAAHSIHWEAPEAVANKVIGFLG
jgi:pimeloyl-ACP methyl ester carboxylesterase